MDGCLLDLLTGGMSIPQPASRKTDPVTSHLAAIKAQSTQLPHIERIRLGLERIGRYDRAATWETVKADFLALIGGTP